MRVDWCVMLVDWCVMRVDWVHNVALNNRKNVTDCASVRRTSVTLGVPLFLSLVKLLIDLAIFLVFCSEHLQGDRVLLVVALLV